MTPKYKKLNPGTTSLEPKEFARTWEIVRLIVLPEKRHSNDLFINTSQFSQVFKIIASKKIFKLAAGCKNLFLQGKKLC